ncbi:hypothetical protein Golomagni_08175, partial [Golovinomyces magnicellulatus]
MYALRASRTVRQLSTHRVLRLPHHHGAFKVNRHLDSLRQQTRLIHIGNVLIPPAIFTGLFIALWCWKCMMLVIFQNTIIYNPFMPPDARSMTIAEFAKQCGGIQWREERIKSLDGTEIALCVADVKALQADPTPKTVYILYFQGNASSLPPRLPDISRVIERVQKTNSTVNITLVGVSYRGFWTSHDRPYEKGIDKDTEAAFRWVSDIEKSRKSENGLSDEPIVILWGQSVGCGFATNLAAKTDESLNMQIQGLVLETPFTNTRAMLIA